MALNIYFMKIVRFLHDGTYSSRIRAKLGFGNLCIVNALQELEAKEFIRRSGSNGEKRIIHLEEKGIEFKQLCTRVLEMYEEVVPERIKKPGDLGNINDHIVG